MAGKMNEELVKAAISLAKRAESLAADRKGETYLAVLIATLSGQTLEGGSGADVRQSERRSGAKRQSIGELFAAKRPGTDVDKVLAAGYFLEQVEGMESFNIDDLARCFLQAKERIPKNINDSVNKNIKKGTLMEAPAKKAGKKAWLLTRTGEEVVHRGFVRRAGTPSG